MCLPVRREWKHSVKRNNAFLVALCSLHVPSRSEGMETNGRHFAGRHFAVSLHVPSRSEGMETACDTNIIFPSESVKSTCAFPFGGNGNRSTMRICLWIRLLVYMCLPVRREWKRSGFSQLVVIPFKSTCAFPFGGNGNDCSATATTAQNRLHVPSRSEGMETSKRVIFICLLKFLGSTCAFPFGGNGNVIAFISARTNHRHVYMCLPVRRESKHFYIHC